ncbi:MAG: NAD(P)/FAD-dependent oxidoreductase [Limisphaerales bacterium]
MNTDFDIAVVGSGFGGSLMAMIARRLGRSVVLLERGRHPRFVIGESSTPLANLLLEELAQRYDLPRIRPLAKWGSWQRDYPAIGCGLKRGFTFYHHHLGRPFAADPDRRDQLLVAASPRDEIADMHWYRPDFDHFLVHEAQQAGVEYLDEAALTDLRLEAAGATLTAQRHGKSFPVRCRLVLDASGSRGFLHRALRLPEIAFEHLPPTQGLYTHFSGVRKMTELLPANGEEAPPYPPDDAAVHHVFEGGWIWVLRFNNGLTSAGVAATDALANDLRFADGAATWSRLLERLPTVRAQFVEAREQFPFVHATRLPFCSATVAGAQWALLPSAAGFVDPLLSTGFPLTLLGVARLAAIIGQDWGSERMGSRLTDYARQTRAELETTAQLIGALYASMKDFEIFAALSLLYFAAASFSETARRLGRPELAPGFLLCNQPDFAAAMRRCCGEAGRLLAGRNLDADARTGLLQAIRRTIEPFDLIGLSDASRRNWHPVKAQDLLNGAPKLGLGEADLEELLRPWDAA